MVTFSKQATYILLSLVCAMGGIGLGIAAYAGDRAAELRNEFNFGEWRLPLAILIGLVWAVPAAVLYYHIVRCQQESKRIEAHFTPTMVVPIVITLSLSQVASRDVPSVLVYLLMGIIYSLFAGGWTYVLHRRLKNDPRFG